MSQFRVYFKNRHIATVWAHDEEEARYRVSRDTGMDVDLLSAVDLIEHDRGNEC